MVVSSQGGRHRAPRACWRVRLHRAATATGTVGQHVAIVVGLHAAAYTLFESGVKHVLAVFVHVGH
jgi:hypothetical protein